MRSLLCWFAMVGCGSLEPAELPETSTALRTGPPRVFEPARPGAEAGFRACWVANSNSGQGDWTWLYMIDDQDQPIWATTRGHDGRIGRMRWQRTYDADGVVERVVKRSSGIAHAEVFTYVDGRLATYGTEGGVPERRYEWDDEGRLARWETVDDSWAGTWDADGHLVRERQRSFYVETDTHWTWEGDRLVAMRSYTDDSGSWSIEWDEWDGDLPTHGAGEQVNWEGYVTRTWEEAWTWEGGLPTLRTESSDGVERVVGAWTWDGDRLLEATAGRHELWTWDAEGRPESLETTYSGDTSRQEWTWSGDRLVETRFDHPDGSWSVRYSPGCPAEAWERHVPGGRGAEAAATPLPRAGKTLPRPW